MIHCTLLHKLNSESIRSISMHKRDRTSESELSVFLKPVSGS